MMRDRILDLFRLTRREYFADFFITPPLTLMLAVVSLRHATLLWPILFVCGLFAWTLYEYVVHRASHRCVLLRDIHFLHHSHPRDYIAVHPIATLSLYVIMWIAFGIRSSSFMVGFSCGYVAYSLMHTIFHFARIDDDHPLFTLKRHHALHHQLEDVNFGVTTSLWDHVFCTHRK